MIGHIIAWSLRNKLFVVLAGVLLLAWGGWQAARTPVDVFPDLTAPAVTVVTEAHGMAPTDVENLVTFPIETALNGAPGVRRVRSATKIGLSVVTHLAEDALAAWLKELKRLVKPGGILLLSIQGTAQLALNLAPPSLPLAIHRAGFYEKGPNPQLDGMISDPDYYRDVLYSHDYIFAQWQSLFDVLDIVEGIAGNQDIVILHRRND